MKETLMKLKNDNAGVGVVEMVLILVVLVALVLIFKTQIAAIVEQAFASITGNATSIISNGAN